MRGDWNSFRTINKTRVKHQCAFCNRMIPIGSVAHNFVGEYEGDFQNWYADDFCLHNNEISGYSDEGINGDELFNWVDETEEMGNCPVCGNGYNSKKWSDDQQTIEITCRKCGEKWTRFIGFREDDRR